MVDGREMGARKYYPMVEIRCSTFGKKNSVA